MKDIYIHIGSYKTGTTTIQSFCSENRKLLAKKGCYYPNAPGNNRISEAHHGLALSLFKNYGGLPAGWYRDENSFDDYIYKYLSEISSIKENKILFSSEEFCQLINLNDPYIAMQRLKNEFIDFNINIIFYVRDPLSLVKSVYNQFMREVSRKVPLKSFIDWFYYLDKKIMLPYEAISIWEDVFGEENIKIKIYSKSTDHLNEFFNILNIPSFICNNEGMNKNIKSDDRELERGRVKEVFSVVPSYDINSYLSPQVLLDFNKWANLQVMLDNINESYGDFLSKYASHLKYQPITVFDLISHNEKITSFDVSSYLANEAFISEIRGIAYEIEGASTDYSRKIFSAIEKKGL